jgi:hypothetical protein
MKMKEHNEIVIPTELFDRTLERMESLRIYLEARGEHVASVAFRELRDELNHQAVYLDTAISRGLKLIRDDQ